MDYEPLYFLRTHSKNNSPTDVQTQIWQCLFEPDTQDSSKYTNIVATCGGTSVCFIDIKTGEVVLKYNRSSKGTIADNLYALAWTSLPLDDLGIKQMNILATSGGKSAVILIHPEAGCCYQIFRTVLNKNNVIVCSLLFHPKNASMLFCGHDDGHIQIWDVGVPSLPTYNVTPTFLLKLPPVGGDVYNMVFSVTSNLLFSGCDKGLFAWKIEPDKFEKEQRTKYIEFDFDLPAAEKHGIVIDSVCLVRDDILAVKCALHGYIYVFNVSLAENAIAEEPSCGHDSVQLNSECLLMLKWSDTDNFYMNIGVDRQTCILACGDDKGTLWLYDLASYVNGEIRSPLTGGPPIDDVECVSKLDWPDLEDTEVEKAGKIRLDSHDIVIDNCNVSRGAEYIVAVTSNNMVCIWKRS